MKPVILFNFGYHRKGWIAPIEALKNAVEIVYLYYTSIDQEPCRHTNERVVFWSDYKSIDDLLNDVKPQKVVLMSVESGLGILLNYASKKRKITTYLLQHGMFSNYQDYRERERRIKEMGIIDYESASKGTQAFDTFAFYKASLRFSDLIHFVKFPLYYFFQKKEGYRFASRWFRFKARMPDYYICYTPQNAIIHKELDKPLKQQFLYIGNPEIDAFLNVEKTIPKEPYYLLIDQPLAENRFKEHLITQVEMVQHYKKLNDFCLQNDARLYVKLHPESYHSPWLPQHENILWIKDHEHLPGLLIGALGCFGYFSSLLIPAIITNKTVLFKVSENEMQRDAHQYELIQLLNFWDYSIESIRFSGVEKTDTTLFISKYLYFSNGSTLDRLKEILLSQN